MKKILLWIATLFGWKKIEPVREKPRVKPVTPRKQVILHLPKCPVERKTSYNEQIAKQEAIKMSKKNLTKMRAYRCMFCPHWHLTHKANRTRLH